MMEKKNLEGCINIQVFINSFQYPIYIININDYSIELMNLAAKEFYGEPNGKFKCHEFIYNNLKPCSLSGSICSLEIVKKTKKEHIIVKPSYNKNGVKRVLEFHTNPILDTKGDVIQVIVYAIDITERIVKHNEEIKSNKRLEFLLKSNPAVIYTSKPHGKFDTTFISENVERILGYKSQKFIETYNFWVNIIHPEDRDRIFTTFAKIPEKKYFNEIYRIRHKNGEYRWIIEEARLIEDDQGNPLEIVGYWSDITDRKQTEKALQQSEEKYRLLFEFAPIGIGTTDFEGRTLTYNHKMLEIMGYTVDEFEILNQPESYVNPDEYNKIMQELHETGSIRNLEVQRKRKDGSEYTTLLNSELINTKEEKFFLTTIRDITEYKETVKELYGCKIRSKAILDAIPDYVFELTADGTLLSFQGSQKNHQISPDKFLGKKLEEVFPKEIFHQISQAIVDALQTGNVQSFEYQLPLNDRVRYYEARIAPKEKNDSILIIRDITDRKEAEQAIFKTEEKFKNFFQSLPIGLYQTTPSGAFLEANSTFLEMLGYSTSTDSSLINAEEIASLVEYPRKKFINMIEKYGEVRGLEVELKRQDGTTLIVRENAKAIKDKNGSILRFEGSFEDITEQKRLEEALRIAKDTLEEKVIKRTYELTQEKYRINSILKVIPEGIIVFNVDGRVEMFNNYFKSTYEKIYNKNLPKTIYEFQIFGNPLATKITKFFYSQKEGSIIIEPLNSFHIQLTSTRLESSSDNFLGLIITIRDVSEFIEFERTQKQFIATVSHELRTPMTIIDLSIKNLQKYWEKLSEEQREAAFNMVIKSSFHLKHIIEDVLIISKIETREFKLNKINFSVLSIITETIAQFDSNLREKIISIKLDVCPQLKFYGDPKRLSKVFSILIDNAIKFSINEGSFIKIVVIDRYLGEYNSEGREGILIQVIDSGQGIHEIDLPNVFNRFYRSKSVVDIPGIGIGLFIAKTIVAIHQGDIFVKSTFGKGSTFSIFLPELNDKDKTNDVEET